ncbi:unnamed protein product [Danaus chrysippus]|uniref:(African queen) hypothetical protein n=1 Tax=Danaus chrysippus TaxID=151541 RepID=A0A8J2W2T5_9NEOP|nr:unnamed protein product [Danaus chrysippus]
MEVHQVHAYCPLELVMKTFSCFCSSQCERFRMGIVKYSTMKAKVDDVYSESDTESYNEGSTSIMKLTDMSDLILVSNFGLNTDDFDGLLKMPDTDTNKLFPVPESR